MNSERDMNQLLRWMSGRVPVDSFNIIVIGKRQDVPTVFSAFACLYQDSPRYRFYDLEGGPKASEAEVRQAVASCRLPDDATPRYRKFMAKTSEPALTPEAAWVLAGRTARTQGIPIGFYTQGATLVGSQLRGMLWMVAYAPPTIFLDHLKKVVAG